MNFLLDEEVIKRFQPMVLGAFTIGGIAIISYLLHRGDQDHEEPLGHSKAIKPAGIFNQGNTCFVNSLLQSLGSMQCFINNVEALVDKIGQTPNADEEVLIELHKALLRINSGEGNVDISDFLRSLSDNSCNLINFEQQDAYELYSKIICCFENVSSGHKNISLSRSYFSEPPTNSLIGYLRSSITCTKCNSQQNIKVQPFYDLSFEITPQYITSLNIALHYFQQKQRISGWVCTKCSVERHCRKLRHTCSQLESGKPVMWETLVEITRQIQEFCVKMAHDQLEINEINEKLTTFLSKLGEDSRIDEHPFRDQVFTGLENVSTEIFKQTVITKFPSILVIHLKQLSVNPYTGRPVLLRKSIDFSEQLIIPVRQGAKKYQLTSLLSHIGNEHMGHYFSFRRTSSDSKQWFVVSDTLSKQCEWSSLKRSLPYMFFYQLKGME